VARDELAPADPSATVDTEIDPTSTIPAKGKQGQIPDLDGGEYAYWLRDGVTPYRSSPEGDDFSVFSKADDAWMYQHMVDPDKMWPSTAGEVASLIGGGRQRLTEPVKGAMPIDPGPDEDFAPVPSPDDLAEADSVADTDPLPDDGTPDNSDDLPDLGDLPGGGMNEQQIRDAGLRIDLPFDDPLPAPLKYKDTGQQTWTPPPGFRQGMPPIDEKLAADLGVPRDLGETQGGSDGSSSEPESGA
jgi:hypothetical protein